MADENRLSANCGHKFSFTHASKNESPYDGATQCEVLEVEPFAKLSYSWKGD
jgi:uncharacterized protein YndB with AHSA1/START domain